MRPALVAGNWKMNGDLASAQALAETVREGVADLRVQVLLCPPYVHLDRVAGALAHSGVGLAAQDLNEHSAGAHTGEICAEMLADLGCSHVIVGHSERRHVYGEANARVATKFARAREAGLVPLLCVGERQDEREQGRTQAVIAEQLQVVLEQSGPGAFDGAVIAYEPVWAIGTGLSASPEQAQEVHAFIRGWLHEQGAQGVDALPILYGGSVKADNAAGLFAQPDVDGGLIGGAALQAESFIAICKAAEASSPARES
ncbi:triose-phosphate isomerase [Alkalilimnicola sp. S0819]|uniref:triose-phosphate isomerase n=1 Tax=Alkalilimnicola sp. S0819 TaxID=2613922 RepID=UPI00126221D8|nr:triose-phosphate isomerase [Alkalilimnicola sp. S0819]KAB7628424.1 triose-phosphate isomerase [Alkalilimnicola sp. S0819]MPQ15327.1 triose-phosphate isomerase [Alkalilimnicola sp. S0819]